jgi:hypothetical protein
LEWVNKGLNNTPSDFSLRMQKAQIFVYYLDSHHEYVDDAIEFFEENFTLNPRDAVNYYYLCEAISIRSNETAKSKIYRWFSDHLLFPVNAVEKVLPHYEVDELLNCLKYWNTFGTYLNLYNIANINIELVDEKIPGNPNRFLAEFEINRIIFLSKLMDILKASQDLKKIKPLVSEAIQNIIFLFSADSLSEMIPSARNELETFAEQFAKVVSTTSLLCMREFPRCTGFVIGSLYNEKRHLLDNLLDGADIFKDVVLRFTEILYIKFDMPLT